MTKSLKDSLEEVKSFLKDKTLSGSVMSRLYTKINNIVENFRHYHTQKNILDTATGMLIPVTIDGYKSWKKREREKQGKKKSPTVPKKNARKSSVPEYKKVYKAFKALGTEDKNRFCELAKLSSSLTRAGKDMGPRS